MEGKGDMSKRPASIGIALAAVGVLALAACGESAEEEALADVCDANASIQAHIEDLQGLEITPTSGESPEGVQVRETLNAIRSDLGEITDASDELAEETRQQVEVATDDFLRSVDTANIRSVGGDGGLVGVIEPLTSSYEETLASIECE